MSNPAYTQQKLAPKGNTIIFDLAPTNSYTLTTQLNVPIRLQEKPYVRFISSQPTVINISGFTGPNYIFDNNRFEKAGRYIVDLDSIYYPLDSYQHIQTITVSLAATPIINSTISIVIEFVNQAPYILNS